MRGCPHGAIMGRCWDERCPEHGARFETCCPTCGATPRDQGMEGYGPGLRRMLYDIWSRIHVRRFDEDTPNLYYAGINRAADLVEEYAEQQGVHNLRRRSGRE